MGIDSVDTIMGDNDLDLLSRSADSKGRRLPGPGGPIEVARVPCYAVEVQRAPEGWIPVQSTAGGRAREIQVAVNIEDGKPELISMTTTKLDQDTAPASKPTCIVAEMFRYP